MNTLKVLTLMLVIFAALTYIDNHRDCKSRRCQHKPYPYRSRCIACLKSISGYRVFAICPPPRGSISQKRDFHSSYTKCCTCVK